MKTHGHKVRFAVDATPTGDLYARRKHARRITPYPHQMQALIDADLLTADYYEEPQAMRGMSQDAHDAEVARLLASERPHVLRDLWDKFTSLFACA